MKKQSNLHDYYKMNGKSENNKVTTSKASTPDHHFP